MSQCNKACPGARTLAMLLTMLLAPAPSLAYVILLPAGLLAAVCVLGVATYVALGRIRH